MNSNNRYSARPQARPRSRGKAAANKGSVLTWLQSRDHRLTVAALALTALLAVFTVWMLRSGTTKNVDFSVIRSTVTQKAGDMRAGDANALKKTFDLDADAFEDWMLLTRDYIMDVTEVLIVKSADGAALDEVQDAVNARLSSQKESFRNYGTDQHFLLTNAAQWRGGSYLFYAVGESADLWQEAFLACVR